MKKIFSFLFLLLCMFWMVSSYGGGRKVIVRGNVVNYKSTDSLALYDALGRQKAPLEKMAVDAKGNFKCYYNPVETGYYMLQIPGGKNVLCVIAPEQVMDLQVDAATGMILSATNSPENQLFHDYQAYLLSLEKQHDSLMRIHQEKPIPDLQQKMQMLELSRVQFLANLCLAQPDNYAAAALMENLQYEVVPELFDTVFTKLIHKYPSDDYIRYRWNKLVSDKLLAVGVMAPDFTLPDTNGVRRSLQEFRGKVVVIDFWASWCRPCRQENPNMVRLYRDYHDKGLEILGVSLDGDRESWMQAIHKDGLYWTQVSDLKRWNSAAGQLYQISSIPATIVVDKEGRIAAKNLRGDELRAKIQQMLAE